MGQGISVAVGLALSAKLDKADWRVYCLTGDGEHQEGEVWEAYMSAAHYKLDNLTVIIDKNNLEIDGPTSEVMNVDPLDEKLKSFGFEVFVVDGHDMGSVLEAFNKAKQIKGKPQAIIANTIKGKGVSFMENEAGWHGKAPSAEEKELAIKELE